MYLIGEKVSSVKYGVGKIINIEGGYMTIQFPEKVRTFKYPDAFRKYITLVNNSLQTEMFAIATATVEEKEKNLQREKDKSLKEVMQSVKSDKAAAQKGSPGKRTGVVAKAGGAVSSEEKRYSSKNIAFKCTYNDGGVEENGIGFIKICSDDLIGKYAKKEGIWCSNWECPCKDYYDGKISRRELDAIHERGNMVCYECVMLIDWIAQAGTHRPSRHREEISLKIKNAFKNSLGILTTRVPNSKEKDRFIFAIFIIKDFFEGDEYTPGYVSAHPKYRLMFTLEEGRKMPFWKYHSNKKQPSRPLWATGLFRYIPEDEGVQILRDAAKIKKGSKDELLANDFLRFYCHENRLDSDQIGEAQGALTRIR